MRLSGIRIFGFKTFAQATTMTFDSGITAIVGPNGSGKSNLVDAIRWVLGEQSSKSLRSSKTDDVIFAGNDKRKALGMAEVSLTFDNSDGKIDLPFKEVQITRRAYRAGDIEYFVNKDRVRLRDVHELLMGTGLGPGSYAILSQGQIDAILVSKPSERRALFEETSGINKFIARKNEAMRRIEGTNANVVRLNDLAREVEARMPELDAQIRRAKRYRNLTARVRDLVVLTSLRSTQSRRDWLAAAQKQAQDADTAQNTSAQAALQAEEHLRTGREELVERERACERARIEHDQARVALTTVERDNAAAKARLETLTAQFIAEHTDEQRRTQARAALLARIESLSAQVDPLRERVEELQLVETQAALAVAELRMDIDRRFSALRAFEAEANARATELAKQRNQRESITRELERTQHDVTHVSDDLTEAKRAAHEAKEALAGSEAMIAEHTGAAIVAEEATTRAKEAFARATNLVPEAQARLRAATSELAGAEARLHTLEELEANLEGHVPGTRAVMDAHNRGDISGMIGVVSTLVTVEEQYARALDMAFGAGVSNIVTVHSQAAEAAIEYLRSRELGRATFLPLDLMQQRTGRELGRLRSIPGVIAYAHELVMVEEQFRGVVAFLVGRTLIVDTMRTGVRLAREEQIRDTIVTLEGDQLLGGGAMSGGRNRRGERSILARRAQAQTMRDELLPGLREAIIDAEADLAKAAHEATQAGAQRDEAQRAFAELNASLKEVRSKAQFQRSQMQQTENRANQLEGRFQELKARLKQSQERLVQLPALVEHAEELESGRRAHENELSVARAQIETSEMQAREARGHAANARERLAALGAELEASKTQYHLLDADSQRVFATREQASAEIERLEIDARRLGNELEALRQTCEEAQVRVRAAQVERERIVARIAELDALARRERQNERELLASGEQARRRVAELEAELGMLEDAAAQQPVSDDEREEIALRYANEPDSILLELPKLREDVSRLSNVNLNAEADRMELEARETELRTQLDDLARARELLLEGIRELDASCETQFVETFETVRIAFNDAYAELFPGGEARMWLTDPDNVNESGVEISVKPPGKKMTSLAALSGGERAMTAAALIFALIRVKPSPFYLLDEIDAALDEMNVERFSMMVRNLATQAQLLIVTHNKKTMELAQRMYGITMAEAGVSSVVSAALDRELAHA